MTEASAGDGKSLLPLVESVEEHLEVKVECVLGDTAYGEAENRVECAKRRDRSGLTLARPSDPEVDKSAFALTEGLGAEKQTLTCPGGQTVDNPRLIKDPQGRLVRQFIFSRTVCAACQFFARCVRQRKASGEDCETAKRKIGRTVTLHFHESVLREARERQATPEFRAIYRERAKVERKLAELMGHGLRQARYVGRPKKRLQALWTAAMVNLKRLFKLAKDDLGRLVEALSNVKRRSAAITDSQPSVRWRSSRHSTRRSKRWAERAEALTSKDPSLANSTSC